MKKLKILTTRASGSDNFTGIVKNILGRNSVNSTQTVFRKEVKEICPNWFYEGGVTVLPKTRQRHYKKTTDE